MSIANCLIKVKAFYEKSEGKISAEALDDFAHRLEKAGADTLTKLEFQEVARAMHKEYTDVSLKIHTAERLQSLERKASKTNAIIAKELGGKTILQNFENAIHGGALRVSKGGRGSNITISRKVSTEIKNLWDQGIKPYKEIIEQRFLTDEIFQELHAIQNGLEVGKSGSKYAASIAGVINTVQQRIFEYKKSYNPYMRERLDFLFSQVHDRERVSAVPRDVWVAKADKAFKIAGLEGQEKLDALGDIYDRIKAGVYGTVQDIADESNFAPGELHKPGVLQSMTKSRALVAIGHAESAGYFKEFGPTTIGDLLSRTIDKTGKDIGALATWGAKPQETFNATFDAVLRRAPLEDKNILSSNKRRLEDMFSQQMGYGNSPANNMLGKVTQGVTNIIYAAQTGASVLRMFPDLIISSGMNRSLNGRTVLGNAFDVFSEFTKSFLSTEHRTQALQDLQLFSHSAGAHMMGVSGTSGEGFGGSIAQKMSSMAQLDRWAESMKVATVVLAAKDMAAVSHLDFDKLSLRYQEGLQGNGIGPLEWALLRRTVANGSDRGVMNVPMMTPEGMSRITDAQILDYMNAKNGTKNASAPADAIFRARKSIEYGLSSLYGDMADFGSSTASAKNKAFMYGGDNINTPLGASRRIFWQFKSSALATYDALQRIKLSGGDNKSDLSGMGQTMAGMMFMWAIGDYAKEALKNKSPQDPMQPEFLLKAALASGGLGLAADAFQGAMQQGSPYGRAGNVVLGIVGPGFATAAKAVGFAGQYASQMTKSLSTGVPVKYPNRQLFDFASNLIPGQNMLGIRGALDYFGGNGIRESLDTGFTAHMAQSIRKEKGLGGEQRHYLFE